MSSHEITFKISGMHCASCASNSERKLRKVSGVKNAAVSYATEQATVVFDPKKTHLNDLVGAVESLGYIASLDSNPNNHSMGHNDTSAVLKTKLSISILLTIPLMLAMLPGMPMWLMDPRLQLLLATPIQFWVGQQNYLSAWNALKNGMTNMDTLIVMGTSVAYFYSLAVVLFGDSFKSTGMELHVYFETSAAIITLIMLGKYLEARAKSRTSDAITKLLDLQAKKARIIKDGQEYEVPLEQVVIGDIVKVKPGEKIPVDGLVQKGSAAVDESMVTGESLPITKQAGDQVIGATMAINGSLTLIATKVGNDTFLAHVVDLVKTAQSSKAPIQNLVDKVSSVFVPAVITLSLITFGLWFLLGPDPVFANALVAMISVLIIACPCALGLATPTSIMVGVGRGADAGILIKDAQYLEYAGKLNTIIFDKTGTLTEGKPTVQQFIVNTNTLTSHIQVPHDIDPQDYIRSIVLSLENESHHPLAGAIVEYMSGAPQLPVKYFEDVPGKGVIGTIAGQKIVIGTIALLADFQIEMDQGLKKTAQQLASKAQTTSHIAVNGRHVGLIGIADTLRKSSKPVIKKLTSMGLETVMLTGDNKKTAQAIAAQVGIQRVKAEVLPQDKQSVVYEYKKQHKTVAMVGDGINDAPALAAADIGIAMGLGTDVAIETAGITLLRSDIKLVPQAIQLSRKTLDNIKQNLAWAFGYNIILIPVAMGILYPFFGITLNPILASAAMAFSSVSVVLNALRLKNTALNN